MTIAKALNRLSWRFSQGKAFEPNKLDIESFNEIISWVNESREAKLDTNVGFTKLYIWAFSELCQRYKATPMDMTPQKQLHKLLGKPLDYFIMKFTEHLNNQEREDMMIEADLITEDYLFATDEEKQERAIKMHKLLENPENRVRFEGRSWEQETVKDNLLAQAAEALIRFKL